MELLASAFTELPHQTHALYSSHLFFTVDDNNEVSRHHNTVGDERQLALFFTAVQLVDAVKRLPLVV